MRALYFDGQPTIKELPRPEPGPGEVLVKVHLAGICRTDLEALKGYHGFKGIMGHEFVGQVAAPEDSPWLGQRVAGEITIGCGACDLCRRGLAGHCRQRQVLGINDRDAAGPLPAPCVSFGMTGLIPGPSSTVPSPWPGVWRPWPGPSAPGCSKSC